MGCLNSTAGNDRWWEARTLWGGIVNQSRNLVIAALAYTSADAGWARAMVGWVSAFGVASKHLLRGEQAKLDDIQYFMSQEQARELQAAQHGPNYCAAQIAVLLHSALRSGQLPGFAFLHLEQERSKLVDYVGGCERILKTPVADVFEINLRRIVLAFLLLLPFGTTAAAGWFTPLVQLLVAYFYLSLDQIGREFQNPFGKNQLSYLPLDAICTGIQANLQALLAAEATKKQNGGGGEPCPRCFVSADAVDGSNPAGRLPQVPQSSDPSSPSSVHHVVRVAASDDGQCVCSGRAPQEEFFTSRPCLQKRPSR